MLGNKKILMSLLGAVSICWASSAAAQNSEAVMLKIHDINPVKNEKGVTITCEFFATVYNLTSMNFQEMTINLDWLDEAVSNMIKQEEMAGNNRRATESTGNRRKPLSTAEYTSSNISSSISIPSLKSNSQKTIKGRVNTDRCFLLAQDPRLDISSCNLENQSSTSTSSGGKKRDGNFSCAALFHYISPKNPQYYTDFMAVTIDEQEKVDQKTVERNGQELDSMFRNVEVNLSKITKALNVAQPRPVPVPQPTNAQPSPAPQPTNAQPAPQPEPQPVAANSSAAQ